MKMPRKVHCFGYDRETGELFFRTVFTRFSWGESTLLEETIDGMVSESVGRLLWMTAPEEPGYDWDGGLSDFFRLMDFVLETESENDAIIEGYIA